MAAGPGMTLEQLLLVLRAEITDFSAKLSQARRDLEQLSEKVQETSERVRRGTAEASASMMGMVGAARLVTNAAAVMTAAFAAAALEAGSDVLALERLRRITEAQGTSWAVLGERVAALTRELEQLGFRSEVIVNAMVQMVTRGHAAAAALDMVRAAAVMARATGLDLSDVLFALHAGTTGFARQLIRLGLITREEAAKGVSLATVLERIEQRFGAAAHTAIPSTTRALHDLGEAIRETASKLGTPLQQPLATVLDGMTRLVRAFGDFVSRLDPAVIRVVAFASAVFGGARALQVLLHTLGRLPLIGGAFRALEGATGVVGRLGGAIKAAGGVVPFMAHALLALVTPAMAVRAAITAVVAAWSFNWFRLRDITAAGVERITGFLRTLRGQVAETAAWMATWVDRTATVVGKASGAGEQAMRRWAHGLREFADEQRIAQLNKGATAVARGGQAAEEAARGMRRFSEETQRTTVGVFRQAEDAAKKWLQALQQQLALERLRFDLGEIGAARLIAAYDRTLAALRRAARGNIEVQTILKQVELERTRLVEEQVQRRIEALERELDEGRVTAAQALAALEQITGRMRLTPDMQERVLQVRLAFLRRQWHEVQHQAARQIAQAFETFDERVQKGTVSVDELRAALDRLRKTLESLPLPPAMRAELLEAFAARARVLLRQAEEAVLETLEIANRAVARVHAEVEAAIADLLGDVARRVAAESRAAAEAEVEQAREAYARVRELVMRTVADAQERARLLARVDAEAQETITTIWRIHAERRRRIVADEQIAAMRFLVDLGVQGKDALLALLEAERAALDRRTERWRSLTREIAAILQEQLQEYVAFLQAQHAGDVRTLIERLRALRAFYAQAAAQHEAYAALVASIDRDLARLQREHWEEFLTTVQRAVKTLADALPDAVADWVRAVVDGSKTIWDAVRDLVRRILAAWTDMIAKATAQWLRSEIAKLLERAGIRPPELVPVPRPPTAPASVPTAAPVPGTEALTAAGQQQQQAAVALQSAATTLGEAGAAGSLLRAGTTMEASVQAAVNALTTAAHTMQAALVEAAVMLKAAADALLSAAASLSAGGGGGVLSLFRTAQHGGIVRPITPTSSAVVPVLLHAGERVLTTSDHAAAPPAAPPLHVALTVQAIDTQTGTAFLLRHARDIAHAVLLEWRGYHTLRRTMRTAWEM